MLRLESEPPAVPANFQSVNWGGVLELEPRSVALRMPRGLRAAESWSWPVSSCITKSTLVWLVKTVASAKESVALLAATVGSPVYEPKNLPLRKADQLWAVPPWILR